MAFKAHKDKGRWLVLFHGRSLPLPSGGYRNVTIYYCECRDKIHADHIVRALNELDKSMEKKKHDTAISQ